MCRITNQRTYPYDITEMKMALLWHRIGTNLWGKPAGYGNSNTSHLQISYPRHDTLPRDYMIGQKKLLAMKRRTEPLFPQYGGVALYQRMQCGMACGLWACLTSC